MRLYYQDMTDPSWCPESTIASPSPRRRRQRIATLVVAATLLAIVMAISAILAVALHRVSILRSQQQRGGQSAAVESSPNDPLVPTMTPTIKSATAGKMPSEATSPSMTSEKAAAAAAQTKQRGPLPTPVPSSSPSRVADKSSDSIAPTADTGSPTTAADVPESSDSTNAPSIASRIRARPTMSASVENSVSPSVALTSKPSLAPFPQTEAPSPKPSTAVPTLVPTATPTIRTSNPTNSPSPPPTAPPISPEATFRLKMYWQEGYFWQEQDLERKWCLERADCGNDTFEYDSTMTCRELSATATCAVGNRLWIRNCDNRTDTALLGQRFREDRFAANAIAGGWFHQIRIVSTAITFGSSVSGSIDGYEPEVLDGSTILSVDSTEAFAPQALCIERSVSEDQGLVSVQLCNETVFEQLWLPISFFGPFALMPADRVDVCLTQQQQQPKEYEPVGMMDCSESKTTRYWQTYKTKE